METPQSFGIASSEMTKDECSAAAALLQVDPAVIEAEKSINSFLNGLINATPAPPTSTAQPATESEATPLLISNEELAKQQQGRGKKWQPEEDEQLSRAWLKVSQENPTINTGGADQRTINDTFWNRVSDEFLRSSPGSRRPPRSIQQRWAKLHQSISQFGECYEEQERRLPSGTETERVLVEAMKQYKARTEQSFGHYSCWTILRHSRQWTEHLNKPRMMPLKRKLPSDDHPVDDHPPLHPALAALPTASSSSTLLRPSASGSSTTLARHPPPPDSLPVNPDLPPPPKTPKLAPPLADPSPSSATHQDHELTLALNEKRLALIAELVQAIKRKNELLEDFNRLERETNHIKIMAQFSSNESELWFKLKQQEILNEFNLNILS